MSFRDFQTEDRRLVILRGLAQCAGYRGNDILMRSYCASVGHTVSHATSATDLAWLEEQGLVSLERAQGVTVATLTVRGLDVSTGAATVPGVKRPEPGL